MNKKEQFWTHIELHYPDQEPISFDIDEIEEIQKYIRDQRDQGLSLESITRYKIIYEADGFEISLDENSHKPPMYFETLYYTPDVDFFAVRSNFTIN